MRKAKKSKKALRVTKIAVILLFTLGAAGISVLNNWVGKQVAEGLLYQNKGNDTRKNSVLQLEQWGYDLEGFEERYQPRMCSVTAGDGIISPAAVFTCPESGNTVILVHGAGGDHVSMYPVAEMYLKNNWNVIAIDQRACGASEDDKVSFGYFEKQDVAAWVDYAENEMASVKIVVHGQSMGAATAALYAADDKYDRKADAVILDSCIDSMERMFLGVWREMDGTEEIPENYVVSCGDRYLKKHFGFGFEDADVLEKMKENHVKTLMLQCGQDEIVPNQIAEQIFQNIPAENKEICYFDTVDRRTFAYTRDKTYQVSLTISALEEKLSDFGFIRINKANLVNIYQIKKIKSESNMRISAILRNDEKLQINRSYKRSFEEYLKRVRKAL